MTFHKLSALLATVMLLPACAPAQSGKPVSKSEVEEIVKKYIMEHPEVIVESVRQMQAREQAARQQRSRDALGTKQSDLLNDPTSPASKPAAAGQVAIVEFFDYRCGYCKRVFPTLTKVLAENKDVRLIYKEFPILGPESVTASKAALAVGKQGKYEQFHDALMKLQGAPNMAAIEKAAKDLGVDVAKMKSDMDSPEIEAIIARNRQLAETLGIEATPTFVIGGELAPGALDENGFKQMIAKAKEQKSR